MNITQGNNGLTIIRNLAYQYRLPETYSGKECKNSNIKHKCKFAKYLAKNLYSKFLIFILRDENNLGLQIIGCRKVYVCNIEQIRYLFELLISHIKHEITCETSATAIKEKSVKLSLSLFCPDIIVQVGSTMILQLNIGLERAAVSLQHKHILPPELCTFSEDEMKMFKFMCCLSHNKSEMDTAHILRALAYMLYRKEKPFNTKMVIVSSFIYKLMQHLKPHSSKIEEFTVNGITKHITEHNKTIMSNMKKYNEMLKEYKEDLKSGETKRPNIRTAALSHLMPIEEDSTVIPYFQCRDAARLLIKHVHTQSYREFKERVQTDLINETTLSHAVYPKIIEEKKDIIHCSILLIDSAKHVKDANLKKKNKLMYLHMEPLLVVVPSLYVLMKLFRRRIIVPRYWRIGCMDDMHYEMSDIKDEKTLNMSESISSHMKLDLFLRLLQKYYSVNHISFCIEDYNGIINKTELVQKLITYMARIPKIYRELKDESIYLKEEENIMSGKNKVKAEDLITPENRYSMKNLVHNVITMFHYSLKKPPSDPGES
jgi:hypothetical protein